METDSIWWVVVRNNYEEHKVVFSTQDPVEARTVAHELNIHINVEFPGVYYTVSVQGDA